MSGRFPMAEDVAALWRNLVEERDCIVEIPSERWDWRAIHGDPLKEANKTNIKWGGFIDGIDEFDPLFFGISPREAELMDPQQRLMMTYIWKAIEDAGYSAASLAGSRTAILVGAGDSGYGRLIARAGVAIERVQLDRADAVGRPEPDELLPRLAWSERADRDGVLEFAGRGAPGDAGAWPATAANWRLPAG